MWNFIKRQIIIGGSRGCIYHFGDGKDFYLIKEFPTIKEADDFANSLYTLGFKNRDIRVVGNSVFRFKCQTSGENMIYTNKMRGE